MLVKIISILLLPFAYFYGVELYAKLFEISLKSDPQLYFGGALLLSFVLSFVLFSGTGFVAALNHELTHGFWSLLSFKKPVSFTVRSNGSGEFAFEGKKNMMIVLSPYFFPLSALFVIPFFYLLHPVPVWLYAVLGAAIGSSFSIQIRQIHSKQTDFKVYGLFFSLLIILFFQIVLWGCYLSFVMGGVDSVWLFLKSGFAQTMQFGKEIYGKI